MKNRRRYRTLLLIVMMGMLVMMSACGKKGSEKTSAEKASSAMTRSAFFGMLGNTFGYQAYEAEESYFEDLRPSDTYYAQIQACAEWEVIPAEEKFRPNDEITLAEALDAAVRAIHVEDIERAGYAVNEEDLLTFFTQNIADIDISNPDVHIDEAVAGSIIRYSAGFKAGLQFPQVIEAAVNEKVRMAGPDVALNYDGQTGRFTTEGSYSVGDIIYWDATDTELAKGIRITSIDGTSFCYVDAEVSDVFSDLHVSGTFDGKIIAARSASEGTSADYYRIYDEVNRYGLSTADAPWEVLPVDKEVGIELNRTSDSVSFHAYAKGDYEKDETTANASLDFIAAIKNIKITVDYDHNDWRIWSPKKLEAKVSYDTEISANFTGNISRTIALGEIDVNIWGPIFMRLSLAANIGADGSITVSYETQNVMSVCWQKKKGLERSFDSDSQFVFEAEVTLTAEATALADIRVGFGKASASIINAEVTSGLVAIAKHEGDIMANEWCTDVLVYVPLRWGLNQRSCLLTDVSDSLKYKATIWDSSNSPVKKHFHFENYVRTANDECTRGGDKEVVQEEVDENGEPFSELELFEFEPFELEFIEITASLVFMKVGDTDRIGIVSLPDGYTEADLTYVVHNPAVCTVQGGAIAAVGDGSTLVEIKTRDGKYTVLFSVTVFPDYTVDDFVPLV